MVFFVLEFRGVVTLNCVFEGFDLEDKMRYKRRFVTVYRDFPEGCGVPSKRISNADDFCKQFEFKKRIVLQAHGDFTDIKEGSSDYSETETSRIDGLDSSSRDVSMEDGSILESSGGVKYHQEEEGLGESEDHMSSVKKRCLSYNSAMEVETDVVDISKRVLVLGLAAQSNCPWRNPKPRGSRQVN
ncbi:uncharacterized protein LOC17895360 isoform X3 [Capsella rubella]|uniref:uncharacterized protein LOC17895360 isoform X3 n=1 Tax=Capsella rubella TaxID=81985 RepID=UPI000CD4C8D3|nr:uncharacterized protein LOC17895360 isoform X3 [Capsella rubella]